MPDPRGGLGVAAASLALLSACSLLTSFDGLTGGPAAAGDGGPASEGGVDAGASEAGVADGATGADADADGGTWCQQNAPDAAFCADFDERDLSVFDNIATNNGTLTRDRGDFTSPPFSLLAVGAPIKTGYTGVYAEHSAPGTTGTEATISLDVQAVARPSSGGGISAVQLSNRSSSTSFDLTIGLQPSGGINAATYDQSSGAYKQFYVSASTWALGTWVHVRMHEVTSTSGGLVDIDLDGKPVVIAQKVSATVAAGKWQAYVGDVYASGPNTGWTVRIDNVVFDSK